MSPTMETPMYVIKRDGTVKDFDISKIAAALEKAGKATGEFDAADRKPHHSYRSDEPSGSAECCDSYY